MNITREVEKVIAIRDPQKKLDALIGPLELLIERGKKLQFQSEDLGRAVSLLLNSALEEQNAELKEELFSVLLTAVSWNDSSRYVDWITLVEHLPHLSGYCLIYALGTLGWSRRYAFLVILQEYLENPDIFVQIEALEAMKQIWWDAGKRNPELKELMKIAALADLQSQLISPHHHMVSQEVLHEQFSHICSEIVANMKNWFKKHKNYEF